MPDMILTKVLRLKQTSAKTSSSPTSFLNQFRTDSFVDALPRISGAFRRSALADVRRTLTFS
jgi:hypothetical protein